MGGCVVSQASIAAINGALEPQAFHDRRGAVTETDRMTDEGRHDHVEQVLEWTTGGHDLDALDAHTLERFLWHELPTKWHVDATSRDEIIDDLAAAFTHAGRDRMAARCTDAQTREVLAAWEEDRDAGFRAFDAAEARSAVSPPDIDPADELDGLVWGDIMGIVEATARSRVGAALGAAWEREELTPGTRGWRAAQQRIARAALNEPSDGELEGGTLLDAILAERLQTWVTRHRSPAATSLFTRVATHLLHPTAVPTDAETATAPLAQLLRACSEGLGLTAKHYLPPTLVRRIADDHGWSLAGFPGRGEVDEPLVAELHDMARRTKLARRTKRTLVLTTTGEGALADVASRWRSAAESWVDGDDFDAAVGEVALALLLVDGTPGRHGVLERQVATLVTELGWSPGGGAPVDPRDVGWALGVLYRRGAIHGFVAVDKGLDRGLSETGRAAARTTLRARALAPKRDLH